MWFTVIFFAIIGSTTSVYLIFKYHYSYWKKRGVPGLEPEIPFGNVRPGGKRIHIKDVFQILYNQYKGKSPFVGMYSFLKPIALVTDLELAKNILIRDFNDFTDRDFYFNERDDPLNAHLLTLPGQKWRVLRSKLRSSFLPAKMKFMFPTVLDIAQRFDRTLTEVLKDENELEIRDLLARFTTDIIGTCAFGIHCNSLKDSNAEFRKAGRVAFENPRLGTIGRILTTHYPKLAQFLRLKNIRDEVSTFFIKVVRETVDFREKNNIRRNDFMDLLIQLKNCDSIEDEHGSNIGRLSFQEIAAQAYIFFLGGFETASSNMMYILYELAQNPSIQEKARYEIVETLKKHKEEFTYDAMMDMTYVNQIISESLRKHPPVVTLVRKAGVDYRVSGTDQVIEKGTTVFIPAYCFHHDPEIYPDPEVFNPDRFTAEEAKNRHPLSFLAFGDGPRNCIGLRFGRMQSVIGLVTLLKGYRFKVCDRTPIPLQFCLRNPLLGPVSGVWLHVEKIGK